MLPVTVTFFGSWYKLLSYNILPPNVMYDVKTDITNAKTHNVNAMDKIPYEIGAYYIFDRGYFDLKRLYKINTLEAYFIIRRKLGCNIKLYVTCQLYLVIIITR
jgi:hypothetical protein